MNSLKLHLHLKHDSGSDKTAICSRENIQMWNKIRPKREGKQTNPPFPPLTLNLPQSSPKQQNKPPQRRVYDRRRFSLDAHHTPLRGYTPAPAEYASTPAPPKTWSSGAGAAVGFYKTVCAVKLNFSIEWDVHLREPQNEPKNTNFKIFELHMVESDIWCNFT